MGSRYRNGRERGKKWDCRDRFSLMPGEERVQRQERRLRIEEGQQVLASFSSMQSPLIELPTAAYGNLLVVSTKSPAHVEQRLVELDIPVQNVGLIPLAGSDHQYDGPLWTSGTVRPNDPTGLSIAVTNAMEKLTPGTGWFLLEDLNVLSMYIDEETVNQLISHLSGGARNRNVRGVYGVVRSAVGDETYGNYRQAVDSELDLR